MQLGNRERARPAAACCMLRPTSSKLQPEGDAATPLLPSCRGAEPPLLKKEKATPATTQQLGYCMVGGGRLRRPRLQARSSCVAHSAYCTPLCSSTFAASAAATGQRTTHAAMSCCVGRPRRQDGAAKGRCCMAARLCYGAPHGDAYVIVVGLVSPMHATQQCNAKSCRVLRAVNRVT